ERRASRHVAVCRGDRRSAVRGHQLRVGRSAGGVSRTVARTGVGGPSARAVRPAGGRSPLPRRPQNVGSSRNRLLALGSRGGPRRTTLRDRLGLKELRVAREGGGLARPVEGCKSRRAPDAAERGTAQPAPTDSRVGGPSAGEGRGGAD